ncbi:MULTISPECIES: hypothetical protein [Natrialbaceae]|nr:hypothetical protein [Natronococcus sp. CG52]
MTYEVEVSYVEVPPYEGIVERRTSRSVLEYADVYEISSTDDAVR